MRKTKNGAMSHGNRRLMKSGLSESLRPAASRKRRRVDDYVDCYGLSEPSDSDYDGSDDSGEGWSGDGTHSYGSGSGGSHSYDSRKGKAYILNESLPRMKSGDEWRKHWTGKKKVDDESVGAKVKARNAVVRTQAKNCSRPPNVICRVEMFHSRVIDVLDPSRVAEVRDMGFGGLLDLKMTFMPRQICYWIMSRVRSSGFIEFGDGLEMALDPIQLKCILGLPMEDKVVPLKVLKNDCRMLQRISEIKMMYRDGRRDGDAISLEKAMSVLTLGGGDLSEQPLVTEQDRLQFRTAFLIVVLGALLCPLTKWGLLSKNLLPAVTVSKKASKYDWCTFVFKWLMECVAKFEDKFDEQGYAAGCGGCTLYLLIFYLDHLKRPPVRWGVTPRLKVWTKAEVSKAIKEDRRRYSDDYGNLKCVKVAYGKEGHPCGVKDSPTTMVQKVAVEVVSMLTPLLQDMVSAALRNGKEDVVVDNVNRKKCKRLRHVVEVSAESFGRRRRRFNQVSDEEEEEGNGSGGGSSVAGDEEHRDSNLNVMDNYVPNGLLEKVNDDNSLAQGTEKQSNSGPGQQGVVGMAEDGTPRVYVEIETEEEDEEPPEVFPTGDMDGPPRDEDVPNRDELDSIREEGDPGRDADVAAGVDGSPKEKDHGSGEVQKVIGSGSDQLSKSGFPRQQTKEKRPQKMTEVVLSNVYVPQVACHRLSSLGRRIIDYVRKWRSVKEAGEGSALIECNGCYATQRDCYHMLMSKEYVSNGYVRMAAQLYSKRWHLEIFPGKSRRVLITPDFSNRAIYSGKDPSNIALQFRNAIADIPLSELRVVFVPVLTNEHWWCMAFDLSAKTAWLMDSIYSDPANAHSDDIPKLIVAVDNLVNSMHKSWSVGHMCDWPVRAVEMVQPDHRSCGVMMLACMKDSADRFKSKWGLPDKIELARMRLLLDDALSEQNVVKRKFGSMFPEPALNKIPKEVAPSNSTPLTTPAAGNQKNTPDKTSRRKTRSSVNGI